METAYRHGPVEYRASHSQMEGRAFEIARELAWLGEDVTLDNLRHTCAIWIVNAGSVYGVAGVLGTSDAVIGSPQPPQSRDIFSNRNVGAPPNPPENGIKRDRFNPCRAHQKNQGLIRQLPSLFDGPGACGLPLQLQGNAFCSRPR